MNMFMITVDPSMRIAKKYTKPKGGQDDDARALTRSSEVITSHEAQGMSCRSTLLHALPGSGDAPGEY